MKERGKFFIGTSNITLPGPKATFPEEFRTTTRLHYYSTLFNSLEVNSSFYKLPLTRTLEKWSTEVDNEFRFTFKLWKEITHAKEPDMTTSNIDKFMDVVNVPKKNQGCILMQFPPSVSAVQLPHVINTLTHIHKRNKSKWALCIEFRHSSWYANDEIQKILHKLSIAVVVHDMPKSSTPINAFSSTIFFLRFHGPSGDYRGSYSNAFLEEYSEIILEQLRKGKDVYVYFNNTMGNAFENARFLKSKIP